MEVIKVAKVQDDYVKRLENLGYGFHTENNVPYWVEERGYVVSSENVDKLESATEEMWDMCLKAVQHVLDKNLLSKFGIPSFMESHIRYTWDMETPSLYGRFDFALDSESNEFKMLEFNADTPTSIFECGVVQWDWKETYFGNSESFDQFSWVDERLIETFTEWIGYLKGEVLHFTCVRNSVEDLTTIEYIRDCAVRAGLTTKALYIDEIGWDAENKVFVDNDDEVITDIFKLYPWEWMVNEEFGKNITENKEAINWIEPSWKMILSNKAILPILWELYPNHKNLLPVFFTEPTDIGVFVKKPLLSREGANVSIHDGEDIIDSTDGEYGEEGFVYQKYVELLDLGHGHLIFGSWVIGQKSCGMSLRESDTKITNNTSRFVPHVFI